MSEMVERVAKVLDGLFVAHFSETMNLGDRDAKEWARAAIEAMLEPTEKMENFAQENFDWGPSGYDDAPAGPAYPGSVWRAMIETALQPCEQPQEIVARNTQIT